MKFSRFAAQFIFFGILIFPIGLLWAKPDNQWQWAADGFGVTVFLKTIHNCTENNDSKVLLKVVNNQDYELEAEFRVTNAYWSKQMTVELKANAADSSIVIIPDERTCRPLVERLVASPKDQPLAEGEVPD